MHFEGTDFSTVGPGTVLVVEEDGVRRSLDPRFDLKRHSPDGFQCGYSGSGPAQLALAILAEIYDDETACRYYQRFKDDVIAGLDGDSFVLDEHEVRRWKETIEAVR